MNEGPGAGKGIVPTDPTSSKEIQLILENVAPDIIKKIPKRQREEIGRILALRQTQTIYHSHSGPIPSPADMEKYSLAFPNGADRIMAMAERNQAARIANEALAVAGNVEQGARGQHYGFIITILMISASVVMVMTGHDTAGSWLGGTTLVGLAAVFVTGKAFQAAKPTTAKPK